MKKIVFFATSLFYITVNAQTTVVSTIAGNGIANYSGDGGQALAAALNQPTRVALDGLGDLIITDRSNNCIRKLVLNTGVISTIAGTGVAGFSGDGGPATAAQLNYPSQTILDANGNLYITDCQNQRVRKINANTGVITTIAGNGVIGYNGDGIAATTAELHNPYDMVVDAQGNLFFADRTNNRIRRIDAGTGIITTIAGNGAATYSGDGGAATAAGLNNPIGFTSDTVGNMYIGDYGNKVVRRIDGVTGIITTFAGNGSIGYSGDGGPATSAQISNAATVEVDKAGNALLITDVNNNCIRKVKINTGIITTIAGDGILGFSGDGGPALSAEFNIPGGTVFDAAGTLYIADQGNNRIRKITNARQDTDIKQVKDNSIQASVYPNPSTGLFTIQTTMFENILIEVYNLTGQKVFADKLQNSATQINLSNLANGVYQIKLMKNNNTVYQTKVTKID